MAKEAEKISKRSCSNPINRTSELVKLIRNPVRHIIKMTMKCPDVNVNGPDIERIKITRAQGMIQLLKAAVESTGSEAISDVISKRKHNKQKLRVKQKEQKLAKFAAQMLLNKTPKTPKTPKTLKTIKIMKTPNVSKMSNMGMMLNMSQAPNPSRMTMMLKTPNLPSTDPRRPVRTVRTAWA